MQARREERTDGRTDGVLRTCFSNSETFSVIIVRYSFLTKFTNCHSTVCRSNRSSTYEKSQSRTCVTVHVTVHVSTAQRSARHCTTGRNNNKRKSHLREASRGSDVQWTIAVVVEREQVTSVADEKGDGVELTRA